MGEEKINWKFHLGKSNWMSEPWLWCWKKEIKCPHKELDSGGLYFFLSHSLQCDNCFLNIQNIPHSKTEVFFNTSKRGMFLGRVWSYGLSSSFCALHNYKIFICITLNNCYRFFLYKRLHPLTASLPHIHVLKQKVTNSSFPTKMNYIMEKEKTVYHMILNGTFYDLTFVFI